MGLPKGRRRLAHGHAHGHGPLACPWACPCGRLHNNSDLQHFKLGKNVPGSSVAAGDFFGGALMPRAPFFGTLINSLIFVNPKKHQNINLYINSWFSRKTEQEHPAIITTPEGTQPATPVKPVRVDSDTQISKTLGPDLK
jgi:hypothetical protein